MAVRAEGRERLLVQEAQRQPLVFAELYEQYVDRIYAYALHSLHDPMAAEDVTAGTFLRALEHLDRYEWRGVPVSHWLYRIAHNLLVARYRRGVPVPLTTVEALVSPEQGPEQAVLQDERQRALVEALATLPAPQRQVVILRYGHDLQYAAIAYILRRSEGAVKQLHHRALRHVQHHVAEPPSQLRQRSTSRGL